MNKYVAQFKRFDTLYREALRKGDRDNRASVLLEFKWAVADDAMQTLNITEKQFLDAVYEGRA